jgi:hypothetical protein
MRHRPAVRTACIAVAALVGAWSSAALAQSVFLFHDESLSQASASEHIVSHDMSATYANPRLNINRQARSNQATQPLWDVASGGGVLSGLNPKILLNASGVSASQTPDKPKVQLAVGVQANGVSDRNRLLPDDQATGRARSVSSLRKGWRIQEYVAYPNRPTRLEGVDVTFASRALSQSALGTGLQGGVWISQAGSPVARRVMDVACNYLMCSFTHYEGPKAGRVEVQFGQNIIYKASFPSYKPDTTFWWMCHSGGPNGKPVVDLSTSEGKKCRAVAVAEELLSATKTMGPWQKQGKFDYTLEADMMRSSQGTWW